MMERLKKIRTVIMFAVGLALIIILFSFQSLNLSSFSALDLSWPYIIAMVACSMLYVLLGAWKWQLISKQWYGTAPGLGFHFSQSAQTMLLAQFLPLSIATAAQRAAILKLKQQIPISCGIVHAIYDLGFELLVAILLVLPTLLQLKYGFDFTVWLASGLIITALCAILAWKSDALIMLLAKLFLKSRFTEKFGEYIEGYKTHGLLAPHFMITILAISSTRFAVLILRLCVGATALGLLVPWDAIAYTTPLATLPGLLPLTPANIGISEWSWAYLLSLWGLPVATGALYAASFRVLTMAAQTFVAIIAYPFGRRN